MHTTRAWRALLTTPILLLLAITLATACHRTEQPGSTPNVPFGDGARGKELVGKYACNACHVIPDVAGPRGKLGPSLDHIASRSVIGGRLPNTPENLSRWLQNPKAINPDNSMPNLGISEPESRDLAAFLGTLN